MSRLKRPNLVFYIIFMQLKNVQATRKVTRNWCFISIVSLQQQGELSVLLCPCSVVCRPRASHPPPHPATTRPTRPPRLRSIMPRRSPQDSECARRFPVARRQVQPSSANLVSFQSACSSFIDFSQIFCLPIWWLFLTTAVQVSYLFTILYLWQLILVSCRRFDHASYVLYLINLSLHRKFVSLHMVTLDRSYVYDLPRCLQLPTVVFSFI